MTAPVCAILEAAEITALVDGLVHLWLLTIGGLLLLNFDVQLWESRVRRYLRRRRLQRIRVARMVSHAR